jgi:hypothetical protein
MPLETPSIDDRSYQQLVDDSLARIPNHTPEWTNFNASDPGVTLIQVFAFLTESLLYRTKLIPERNRLKFLQLLGVPLQPASSARGLITITNERGPEETITLNSDLEVRAGQVSFRTQNGLDVLPVEAYVCFKATLDQEDQADKIEYYQQLYASYLGDEMSADTNADVELYEAVPLSSRGTSGVTVSDETVDNGLWIALLAQSKVTPDDARREIAGKTVSIGLVPMLEVETATLRLVPEGTEKSSAKSVNIDIPSPPAGGKLATGEKPAYRTIGSFSMPTEPGVFEVVLPGESELGLWEDIDPLELGADTYPPVLDDAMTVRLVTWLRLVWPDGVASQVMWAGINATPISQRARVLNELLPAGTSEPDQSATLSHQSIISDSVKLLVTPSGGTAEQWMLTDDLLTAGPEVPTPDLRNPPGWIVPPAQPAKVFALDAEAGRIRFGDGAHGARPPAGATLRISYDYGAGLSGNVAAAAVNQAPALPSGLKVTNPVSTWGGADAETVATGEKEIPTYLQHRDRLVTATDFVTIARRTPGVDIGRVEVLPVFNPTLARQEPGNAPGVVTLMLIPKYSATSPDAPVPDSTFLNTVCAWLEPRRLVTTELFLCGPQYVSIWVSVAIEMEAAGSDPKAPNSSAVVREAVKQRIREVLLSVKEDGSGWPLRKTVLRLELEAEVARVDGVALVNKLLLASGDGAEVDSVAMTGIQLPRLDGIEVAVDTDPLSLDQLRGRAAATVTPTTGAKKLVPVPVIPEEC